MKKFYIAGLLLIVAVSAQAQTLDEGILFSEYNYAGTARSIGMGNAVSAVGGDLGSIGINPAGSAVAGYSQFTISPGVTISTNSTEYTSPFPDLQKYMDKTSRTFGTLPNLAIMSNFDLFRPSGLNNISFGLVINSTNHLGEDFFSYGENPVTSQLASFALLANGIDHSYLDDQPGYAGWDIQTAYDAYMIDYLLDNPSEYLGATENKFWNEETGMWDISLADPIGQTYLRTRRGDKTEMLLNFGMNWNDKLYVGVNMGIPVLDYKEEFSFREESLRPEYFQTGFRNSDYSDYVNYSGAGVYAKIGAIWRPVSGLRIAAAYQTPTYYEIDENYGWYASLSASNISGNHSQQNDGDFSYVLTTAPVYTLGAAYTFGSMGLISFDWERSNYSKMHYSYNSYGHESSYIKEFSNANTDIRDSKSFSEQYRVGAEIKPIPQVAFRAGFNLKRNAQSDYNGGMENIFRKSYSIGTGYSSNNSFFADFAVRFSQLPVYKNYPYDVYDADWNLMYASPEYIASRQKLDVVLTLGWRF